RAVSWLTSLEPDVLLPNSIQEAVPQHPRRRFWRPENCWALPLWVISARSRRFALCPLYPRERTSAESTEKLDLLAASRSTICRIIAPETRGSKVVCRASSSWIHCV